MRAATPQTVPPKSPTKAGQPVFAAARLPDMRPDEVGAALRHSYLVHFVLTETVVIAILASILLIGTPFFRPVYMYYARNPEAQVMALVPLTLPNMTNRAVLSWATNSITEIMTIGFGDFQIRLNAQRPRFTPEGWDSFTKAFVRQKIGQTFRDQQMVLTTVASGTPVIVAQGVNEKRIYEWHVQMPVIMTYATNNNVTQRAPSIIELTIVRVPAEQSPSGIGISAWTIKN